MVTALSTTLSVKRGPLPVVVQQHAEEAALLRHVRSEMVDAPNLRLQHLRRHDDRLAAHLDGLAVAGSYGTAVCRAALERPGTGEVFTVAVRAIEERDGRALDRLIALSAAMADAKRGLISAFGWVSAAQLQGIVQSLLAAPDARRRELAITACRLHGADPGGALISAMRHPDPALRIAALRAAGDLGRTDALPATLAAMDDADEAVAFWAAHASCILGDHGDALLALEALVPSNGPHRDWATGLVLLAGSFQRGQETVRRIAKSGGTAPALRRRVIRACGWLGDGQSVPWLIESMADDGQARVAGEAFSLITGVELVTAGLERSAPEGLQTGPNDDPADHNIAVDEDDGLPWPDPARVRSWWQKHAAAFSNESAAFMGLAPSSAGCTQVLRNAFQRQRRIAAWRLCLLTPGTPRFQVCAPAWRQQRRLATG